MDAQFVRENVRVETVEKDIFLDVWYFRPQTTGPHPVVIVGPGMTLTKDAGFTPLAEEWATRVGYASLLLDYRFFGASDGQPRDLVVLQKQVEDYRSVVKWARQRPENFISDKIVLYGNALSGLSVAKLVVEDDGFAGAIFQSPLLDGFATVTAQAPNFRLIFWATVDVIRSKLGMSPLFVKAIGKSNEFAFINAGSAYNGFELLNSDSGSEKPFTDRPNRIAPRLAFDVISARPGRQLSKSKCPLLLVSGSQDDIILIDVTRNVVAHAHDKITYVELPGGHFDSAKGGTCFQENIDAQVDFLRKLLN